MMANVIFRKAIISITKNIYRPPSRLIHIESCVTRNSISILPILYKSEIRHESNFLDNKIVHSLNTLHSGNSKVLSTPGFVCLNKQREAILPSYQKQELPLQRTNVKIEDITRNVPIEDVSIPQTDLPMEAGKSDIKWRRRRMKRHRLLRWRIKYRHIVLARLRNKMDNRKQKKKEDLERSWKMFGLTKEPPKLTEEEKKILQQEWREQGLWEDPLTIDEYKQYAKISSIMKATDKKQ